jgi:hypothetical protein
MAQPEATVRALVVMLLTLALSRAASAEPCDAGGPLFAKVPGRVKVTVRVGETLKGTILCVNRDTIILSDGSRIRQVPLGDVVKIVKPRDSILNGFAIGAGVGLILFSGGPGESRYAPGCRLLTRRCSGDTASEHPDAALELHQTGPCVGSFRSGSYCCGSARHFWPIRMPKTLAQPMRRLCSGSCRGLMSH